MDAAAGALEVLRRLRRLTAAAFLLLAVVALACTAVVGAPYIAMHLFRVQDIPAIAAVLVWFMVMRPALLSSAAQVRLNRLAEALQRMPIWIIATVVAAGALAGVWLVFGDYPLSMDEFWARADGTILRSGEPLAPIQPEWRGYADALQPTFLRLLPDHAHWASAYLPVNAAIQGILGRLADPLLAALSVLLAADLARRLLPEHSTAPAICALLMATSSQLLLTAMTPYAMTAHLAFNLAWLWLFIRPSRAAQLAALPIAVLAIGLHQAVFFPLFALPFLFEAVLAGRRAAAILQAAAIAGGFLFWSSYDVVLLWWYGVAPAGGGPTGTTLFLSRTLALVADFGIGNFGLMALNLLRWSVWQNVLVAPLVLAVAVPVVRKPGPWRAMLGGIGLTLLVVTVVLAFQGHGWGYRYLHGLLGNACLLATYGWFRLKERPGNRCQFGALLAGACVLSLVLLLWRGVTAASFIEPYAMANRALAKVDADVVLIDAPAHVYAEDLIRNDPFLRNRPKRMTPLLLSDAQLAAICRRYRVAYFTDADAERFGLPVPGGTARPARVLPPACAKAEPAQLYTSSKISG
jgi:hypothetical protein